MRKPPRKKDERIIDKRIRLRVLFSATIIVVGTLFVYYFALSDSNMSRRDQTMVCTAILTHSLILSGVTLQGVSGVTSEMVRNGGRPSSCTYSALERATSFLIHSLPMPPPAETHSRPSEVLTEIFFFFFSFPHRFLA